MTGDLSTATKYYIAPGPTNMCCGIDTLRDRVKNQFNLDPYQKSVFIFCNRKMDRIKILFWEGDGFVLIYKRFETKKLTWPQKGQTAKVMHRGTIEKLISTGTILSSTTKSVARKSTSKKTSK